MEQRLYLTWLIGNRPKNFQLTEDVINIGRHPSSELYLDLPNISRNHARITYDGGAHYIEDLGSSCGTIVDDVTLDAEKPHLLRSGCEIKLANLTIWCVGSEAEAMRSVDITTDFYATVKSLPEMENFRENVTQLVEQMPLPVNELDRVQVQFEEEIRTLDRAVNTRLKEHRILHEIAADIGRILDVDELLVTVLKLVCDNLKAERGLVLTYDGAKDDFRIKSSLFLDETASNTQGIAFSHTLAMQCITKRRIILISDAVNHEIYKSSDSIVQAHVRSVACIPLLHNNVVLGVLYLDNRNRPECFGEDKIDFLKILSVQVTTALVNARLYTQATTDDLTGLESRNIMETAIQEEMQRSMRYERPCSIIMLDLDHFKKINDTYGHQAGDFVLKQTAKVIKASIRSVDRAGRFGGEEFLILLPETDLEKAEQLSERIRTKLMQMDLTVVHKDLSVTASFGVSGYHTHYESNVPLFLEAADKALYDAKDAGRNCVVTAD